MTQKPKKSKSTPRPRREIVVEVEGDGSIQCNMTDALASSIADALITQARRMRAAGIPIEGAVA
jgi:hypothetical protein